MRKTENCTCERLCWGCLKYAEPPLGIWPHGHAHGKNFNTWSAAPFISPRARGIVTSVRCCCCPKLKVNFQYFGRIWGLFTLSNIVKSSVLNIGTFMYKLLRKLWVRNVKLLATSSRFINRTSKEWWVWPLVRGHTGKKRDLHSGYSREF